MDKMKTNVVKQILFPSLGGVRGGFILLFALLMVTGCARKASDYPSVIEIINKGETRLEVTSLLKFCKENKIDTTALYSWNKHWLLYSHFNDSPKLKAKLEKEFPTVVVKLYDHPFYIFDRKTYPKKDVAKEWTNVIMAANLVKDTVMQKQYMEYHRTQLEKWPEVAKGFYNANFQQLLVFRNGRQLILIISIPKGESLDDLNPKTSENNPRVDQWNAIMSKYQEGLEDAPCGSTWILFEHRK